MWFMLRRNGSSSEDPIAIGGNVAYRNEIDFVPVDGSGLLEYKVSGDYLAELIVNRYHLDLR
jgi:hypothetical protein